MLDKNESQAWWILSRWSQASEVTQHTWFANTRNTWLWLANACVKEKQNLSSGSHVT